MAIQKKFRKNKEIKILIKLVKKRSRKIKEEKREK